MEVKKMVKGNQEIETNYPAIDHIEIKEVI